MGIDTGTDVAQQKLDPEKPPRTDKRWKLAIVGLIAAYVVLAAYYLIDSSSVFGAGADSSASPALRTGTPSASIVPRAAKAPKGQAPVPTARATGHPASHPHQLDALSIAAFGPDGTSDGDNPGTASRILDVSTGQPWYSEWYASPGLGNLQSGTGLVLDMGGPVAVTDVRLVLGTAPGADVQLRVGNSPSLAELPPVAAAADASGAVQLTAASPAEGRYVLIWFTRLPSVGQGHYQVSVYNAVVDGSTGS
ncbi:MAG TPA: hypothetical protein VIZ43_00715 [Trebonia sp.]